MQEVAGAHRLFDKLKNGAKYFNLWLEYENQTSPVAKFVKQVDFLEIGLQASVYEQNFNGLEEFFPGAKSRVVDLPLVKIYEEILSIRPKYQRR